MIAKLLRFTHRLRGETSGVAFLEFGFSLPIVLGIGLYGIEISNLALANMRISQIALNLADNASRVGSMQSNNTSQLREIDMNDVLTAARLQGAPWDLTTRGRIIVSSLEEKSGQQIIHWQRCLGEKGKVAADADYRSSYGNTKVTDGTDTSAGNAGTVTTDGMGDNGAKVTAPPSSGVMFVEINYNYKPVFTGTWLPNASGKIHYIASFIVRDKRVFDQIYNPSPSATLYTCDKYTAA